jgi:hypothetical protein
MEGTRVESDEEKWDEEESWIQKTSSLKKLRELHSEELYNVCSTEIIRAELAGVCGICVGGRGLGEQLVMLTKLW